MNEREKDAIRLQTTNQRILGDIRAIKTELELVRVHCIELENIIKMIITDEENTLQK